VGRIGLDIAKGHHQHSGSEHLISNHGKETLFGIVTGPLTNVVIKTISGSYLFILESLESWCG
jgi:hypothetical protein